MMNYFDFDTAKVAVCRSKCLTEFREKFTAREPWREYCAIKNVPSEARDSQIHILRRQKYIFYIDSAVFSFENDPQSARKRSITTPRGHTVHDAPERVLLMDLTLVFPSRFSPPTMIPPMEAQPGK